MRAVSKKKKHLPRSRLATAVNLVKRVFSGLGGGFFDPGRYQNSAFAVGKVIKSSSSKLLTISLKAPKSQRFSQLSFEGFKPKGKNKIEQILNVVLEFFGFLLKYFRFKVQDVFRLFNKALGVSYRGAAAFKDYIVRKLIWSQGRLGRPIATSAILVAFFFVFLFGEVLNSSKLVNRQNVNPGYLSNVSDFIPKKATALTTIPESRKQAEAFEYAVEPGDTLSTIGEKFRISTDALQYVNDINDSTVITVGQTLTIPPVSGLIHTVDSGDTLDSIAEKYDVAPQAIADFNYILDTKNLASGTELVIPGAKVPTPVYVPPVITSLILPPVNPSVAAPTGHGWCIWPTSARIITQYFTWYHNGLDIAASGYLPSLYACGKGTVTRAGWDPWGLGLHVRIDHGNGFETVYGHMSRVDVGYGQTVGQGQQIGIMGSTGRSTGPHVHFIVRYNGVAQNPLNYIQ